MSTHISEELPRLLTGEASRDVVMDAAAHLRHCDDCQQELVSAVVAHASLTSAHRFAPEIVASSDSPMARTAEDAPASAGLPDLSSVFAQVRVEAAAPTSRVRKFGATPQRSRYLIAAAAVIALTGTAVGTYAATSSSSHNGQSALQTVKLAAFETGHVSATATVKSGGQMVINADKLAHLTDKRYEVWLTDSTRTQMQPVGWIGADGKATLTVPQDLMSHYSAIEVSVQPLDAGTYTYSKVSVLRGTYST